VKLRVLAVVPAAVLALGLAAGAARGDAAMPPCVHWWAESWIRAIGYDHLVFIDNTCPAPAECFISTNVAPDTLRAVVPAGEKIDVTTYRAAVVRGFTAKVSCKVNLPKPRRTDDD
jgi:hypothetical protein